MNRRKKKKEIEIGVAGARRKMLLLLLAAFVLRTVLMLLNEGYSNDVSCFAGWSMNLVNTGPAGFYTGGFFADYPPGYLYYLWGAGWLNELLGIWPVSPAGLYILGFLPLLCDLALAWLAWRVGLLLWDARAALWACGLAAFSPVLIFDLAVWKQVDSVLTLALVLCFLLLGKQKWIAAGAAYGLAVLLKPQALMLGPVLAAGCLLPLARARGMKERVHVLSKTAQCAVVSIAVILLLALPFQGRQEPLWLLRKYVSTTGYYDYASVNAFNFFTMLGGNWKPLEEGWLLSFGWWGTLFILAATGVMLWFAIRAEKQGRANLPLLAGFYGIAIFTFGQSMHERYSVPFLILLLFGWLKCRDKGLLKSFLAQSFLSFVNVALVLWNLNDSTVYGRAGWQFSARLCGAAQTVVCICVAVQCWRIFCGAGVQTEKEIWVSRFAGKARRLLDGPSPAAAIREKQGLPWTRRDALFMLLPTLLCAVVSFVNLGSLHVPQTTWKSETGNSVKVDFAGPVEVSQVWIYASIADGSVEIWTPLPDQDGGAELAASMETPYGEMYRWHVFETPFSARALTINGLDAAINEMAFVDMDGDTIVPAAVSKGGEALFDEQDLRPARPSSDTGMYFDEIYHARTAFEHLNGMPPYENTHPPLGKVLIMIGIALFGMNPFGWRCVGALFGVLLVPLLYLTGRLLLRSREYALLGAGLLAFDFMRFTQSRIGTVDTFAVFFILASYYFMLRWLRLDIRLAPVKKQILSLSMSGLFFGLAGAVKWVGIYAGIGLAVLFFLRILQAWRENKTDVEGAIVFGRRFGAFVAMGAAFFVAVPLAVYVLSYMPYFLARQPHTLKDVWELQGYMMGYHSQLTATHPFESRWYGWPFITRPIWYERGEMLPEGIRSSIALLGNPAVWWCAAAAVVCLIVCKSCCARNRDAGFLLIAFCSQYLPWTFITRATFLYHYFPSLPFAVLALCLVLQKMTAKNERYTVASWCLAACSAALFIWFYPALADVPVTREYANSLLWFPSWQFYG